MQAYPIEHLPAFTVNGLNIFLGAQGAGKTFLMEALATGANRAFAEVRIARPVGTVYAQGAIEGARAESLERTLDTLKGYAAGLEAHDQLAALRRKKELTDEDWDALRALDAAYPTDSDLYETPPRLLIVDDYGDHALLQSRLSPLLTYLKRLRHLRLTVFLSLHNFKEIPPALRAMASRVFLFGGLPHNELYDIWRTYRTDSASPQLFYGQYQQATAAPHAFLELHNHT